MTRGLVTHEQGYFAQKFAEGACRGRLIPHVAELVLDKGMVEHEHVLEPGILPHGWLCYFLVVNDYKFIVEDRL